MLGTLHTLQVKTGRGQRELTIPASPSVHGPGHCLGLPFADLPPEVPGQFSSLLPSIYFQTRRLWFSLPPVQLSRSLCLLGFMFTSSLFGLNFSNILCIFRLYLKAGPLLSYSHKGCVFSPKPPTAETGGRRQSSLVSSDVAGNSQIADRGFRS